MTKMCKMCKNCDANCKFGRFYHQNHRFPICSMMFPQAQRFFLLCFLNLFWAAWSGPRRVDEPANMSTCQHPIIINVNAFLPFQSTPSLWFSCGAQNAWSCSWSAPSFLWPCYRQRYSQCSPSPLKHKFIASKINFQNSREIVRVLPAQRLNSFNDSSILLRDFLVRFAEDGTKVAGMCLLGNSFRQGNSWNYN